jgi:L-aspartate semialdehyde sulfurtransferase ferredoxin
MMMNVNKTMVLRFSETTWNQPIVCKLASEYGLSFNIVKAFILPRKEGRMVLELSGKEEDYKRGIQYLKNCGVKVQPIERDITRDEKLCIHCGACTGLCPTQSLAVKRPEMRVEFDPALCIACGWCIKGCPARAMQLRMDEI